MAKMPKTWFFIKFLSNNFGTFGKIPNKNDFCSRDGKMAIKAKSLGTISK